MVFGADLVVQDAVVDRDEPPFARPVRTGGAEVRLGTGLRSAGHDAESFDAGVAEREHDVAGRDLSHVLVKLIAGRRCRMCALSESRTSLSQYRACTTLIAGRPAQYKRLGATV